MIFFLNCNLTIRVIENNEFGDPSNVAENSAPIRHQQSSRWTYKHKRHVERDVCFKDRHFMVFYCILHGNLMCCLKSVKISSLFTIIWDTGQFQKSMNILAIVNNVYK